MDLTYAMANRAFSGALRLFSDYRVIGQESIPLEGPLLVVSNHLSNLDPPLLAVSLRRRLFFMAKKGIFRGPVVSAFLRAYGAYPLNRDGQDVGAFLWSMRILKEGKTIALFPEGARRPSGLDQGLPGVALLALRSKAPILPVAITGTERLTGLWRLACPTGKINVTIGEPFYLPVIDAKVTRAHLESMTNLIMRRVASMLPDDYRGVYRADISQTSSVDY